MQDASAGEIALLVGFLAFALVIGWHRQVLEKALDALPPDLRGHLGLDDKKGKLRRRRRSLADRLTIYGLPDWVPLPPAGRNALDRLRMLMAGYLALIAFGPALWLSNLWGLITLPVVVAVVAARALIVGPWPEPPSGPAVRRDR